jgi:hypothetical protein
MDRRGANAAVNFLYIMALEAAASLEETLGEASGARALREEAARVRLAARQYFHDEGRGVYADGVFEGRLLEQVSQQTNALAVLSGACRPVEARGVLSRVLDPQDSKLCRCTTYFWTYLSEALCSAGMHREMWAEIVRLWGTMTDRGASCCWETFLGDELDSLCHMFSSVPGWIMLTEILGVKPLQPGFADISLEPRFDIVPLAGGTVPTPRGLVRLSWSPGDADRTVLVVRIEGEASAGLTVPPGWTLEGGSPGLRLASGRNYRIVARREAGA